MRVTETDFLEAAHHAGYPLIHRSYDFTPAKYTPRTNGNGKPTLVANSSGRLVIVAQNLSKDRGVQWTEVVRKHRMPNEDRVGETNATFLFVSVDKQGNVSVPKET